MTGEHGLRSGAAASLTLLLCAPSGLATAQVVRSSVELGAGGGYNSNPFLIEGADTGSAVLEVSAQPTISIEEERATTLISGYARHQEYLSRYGGATSLGSQATHTSRLSARTTVRANAFLDSSILGNPAFAGPVFLPPGTGPGVVPGVPGTPLVPPTGVPVVPGAGGPTVIDPVLDPTLIDIGLLGTQARRTSYGAGLGLDLTPGARDTLSFNVSAQRSTLDENIIGGRFNQYIANASYSRQLTETLSLGVQGTVSHVDYDDAPDATIYQPQLIFTARVSPTWTLSGSVGVAITEAGSGLGPGGIVVPSTTSTNFAGSLTACREQARSNLCLSGSRAAAASGFGGVQNFTTLAADYRYQLAERDGITAQLNYSRADGGQFQFGDSEILSATGGWTRQLDERLRFSVNGGYRGLWIQNSIFDTGGRRSDVFGLATIGYRLGNRQ